MVSGLRPSGLGTSTKLLTRSLSCASLFGICLKSRGRYKKTKNGGTKMTLLVWANQSYGSEIVLVIIPCHSVLKSSRENKFLAMCSPLCPHFVTSCAPCVPLLSKLGFFHRRFNDILFSQGVQEEKIQHWDTFFFARNLGHFLIFFRE